MVYTYTTHIIQASRIHQLNIRLKWAELILSALSAGGFLLTVITNTVLLAWIGGLCSTVLLVLSAYFKDRDFYKDQEAYRNTSNKLWSLREEYLSLLIDFDELEIDEIHARREQLQAKVSDVYSIAPITDSKSYQLAQKALKEKESQFFTRDELNQILPQELRRK